MAFFSLTAVLQYDCIQRSWRRACGREYFVLIPPGTRHAPSPSRLLIGAFTAMPTTRCNQQPKRCCHLHQHGFEFLPGQKQESHTLQPTCITPHLFTEEQLPARQRQPHRANHRSRRPASHAACASGSSGITPAAPICAEILYSGS